MPQRTICLAWRRNKVRHDECVELAKIIRGLDQAVLAV
jgi:LysR family hydrogen peroxide-inducible transcriptional activator